MRKSYVFWTILSFLAVFFLIPPALNARAVYVVEGDTSPALADIAQLSSNARIRAGNGIWDGYPLLKKICAAESAGGPDNAPRQFDQDGRPNWGWELIPSTNQYRQVKRDVGQCQVNLWVWGETASGMGLDIVYNADDNATFAKWLYDQQGTAPWSASKHMKGGRGWGD